MATSSAKLPRWKRSKPETRLAVGAGVGIVVGLDVYVGWLDPKAAGLAAWIAGAMTFLIWTHLATWTLSAADTATMAGEEDAGKWFGDAVVVVAALAALLVVALVIYQVKPGQPLHHIYLGIVSIALAWVVVHTVLTLRYARLFYDNPIGGIAFNDEADPAKDDQQPSYSDFYYLGFTVGMTFQVSDTDISKKRIRNLVLGHALISFVFGTMIIAVTINILASLSGK